MAYSYRYDFVLPSKAISAVQEQHAAACEKLGVTQCRITGMRYTLHDGDRVTGQLAFKLSPELARGFGREGNQPSWARSGTCTITTIDVGAAIKLGLVVSDKLADERRENPLRGALEMDNLGALLDQRRDDLHAGGAIADHADALAVQRHRVVGYR